MIPVDQTILHSELQNGNCMQAAVASILELPLDQVPHFAESGEVDECWDLFDEFLKSEGFDHSIRTDGSYPEGDYLASGLSPRGIHHMVVMNSDKLVHDPHPSRAGLVRVDYIYVLHPLVQ